MKRRREKEIREKKAHGTLDSGQFLVTRRQQISVGRGGKTSFFFLFLPLQLLLPSSMVAALLLTSFLSQRMRGGKQALLRFQRQLPFALCRDVRDTQRLHRTKLGRIPHRRWLCSLGQNSTRQEDGKTTEAFCASRCHSLKARGGISLLN